MNYSKSEVNALGYNIMNGTDGMLIGSLITSGNALVEIMLAKCRCIYERDSERNCSTACGYSDKPLSDHREIDIFQRTADDIPVASYYKENIVLI